ncbi:MAG: InlB B-repeat-containing protein, partial [Lachnospiraceae bacterium]|nr:InlB B-repeat-containing protein [Lachnospiraceae bacterium]
MKTYRIYDDGYWYYGEIEAIRRGNADIMLKNGNMTVAVFHVTVSGTKTVTASFNLNGGSGSVASIPATIEEGSETATITLPEAPARSGYEFLGWADSASATTIQYYAGQEVAISNNKTFYAVWQKVSGQIQYMKLNRVSGSTYTYAKDGNPVSVNNLNDPYTVNHVVSYDDYWLAGWSTVKPDASYAFVSNRSDFMRNGETIIPREKMHLDQDVLTLYPVFIYNYAQLTIAVRADGVAPQEPAVNNDKYYYFAGGDGYTKVSVTKYLNAPYAIFSSGQEMEDVFKDEYFDPDMKDTVADNIYNLRPNFLDTDEEYITFYICKYQMNDKTYHLDGTKRARENAYLDYDVNGGQNKPRSVTTRIGGTATVDNSGITTRTGYRFLTWNTKADGTGTTYAPGSTITLSKDILDSNNRIILYAQWIANTDTKYTVQWIDKDTNAVIKSEERGGTTGKPVEVKEADKTLTGYAFDAANTNNVLSGIVAPDESLVLKLYFKKVYTVSYEDTIQSGVTMPDAETVERNATYTVAGNPADFVVENLGYTFLGWSTNANATTAEYACGDTFTVTEDKVLYAIWLKLDLTNEIVTYDGTGHSLNLETPAGLDVVSMYYITHGIEADGTEIPDTRSDTLPEYTNAGLYGYEAYYTVRTGSATSTVTRAGTLTIKPADVTFTGDDKEKTYDGTPLTADGVTMRVTSGQIYAVDGKGVATWTVSGSQTLVGQSTYTVTLPTDINAYTNPKVPYNYNITAVGGKLVVNPTENATLKYQITLNGKTGQATYNGQNQEYSGLTASANLNLQANDGFFDRIVTSFTGDINYDFTVKDENGVSETYRIVVDADSIKVTGKDAGTYNYTPEISSIQDSSGKDASALFAVTVNPGTFVINKAPLTVTSEGAEKDYDGTPLTNDTVTVDGLVNGETVTATATGSITYPGQTANTIQLTWDGTAKENNYAVTKNERNLVVKTNAHALKLTIKANGASVFYNGAAQEVTGFTTETTRTIGGEDVTAVEATVNIGGENTTYYVVGATAVATGTDAGDYISTIDTNGVKVYDADGTEVTNEFAVEATPGTLNIKKRNVTITSASASKVYDGSAVTAESIETVTAYDDNGNGFVSGEGVAAYSFTYEDGQAIYAGDNKRNTFNYTLQTNTKADNYVITKVAGALVIN